MKRFRSAKSKSRQDATGSSSVVVLNSPFGKNTVKIGELIAEVGMFKQKITELESEKEMIFAEKYILEGSNTTYGLAVLDLQAEVKYLSTKLTAETEAAGE